MSECGWAILGAAEIARRNWHSILNAGNGRLVAVASRSGDRARAFVDECQRDAPAGYDVEALEGYEAALARDDVDAVYLPMPTALRAEWAIRAAQAGKHLLAEKPAAVSASALREILDACEKHRVQYVDGVMFLHSRRIAAMRRALDEGAIGETRRITSDFTFLASGDWFGSNIRTRASLEPTGCLGDLGWYGIVLPLWAMGFAEPTSVRGRAIAEHRAGDEAAVPIDFQGELDFPGGVSAGLHASFRAELQQWAVISGSAGYLHLEDFVLPFAGRPATFGVEKSRFEVSGCDFPMRRFRQTHEIDEPANNRPGAPDANLFGDLGAIALSGRLEPRWPAQTLLTQRVMDALMRSAREGGSPVGLEP